MFKFTCTINDDYMTFNKYHTFNSKIGKKSLLIFRLILPILCVAVLLGIVIGYPDPLLLIMEAILMLIASIIWVSFSKKMLLSSIKKNIKSLKKAGKLHIPMEVTIMADDDFICEIAPTLKSN